MIDYDAGVDWGEVVRDYLNWEMTVAEVQAKHGLSHAELYAFLRYKNVPLRGRGHRVPPRLNEAMRLYLQSDVPVQELCRNLSVSTEALYHGLRRYGAPLRSEEA